MKLKIMNKKRYTTQIVTELKPRIPKLDEVFLGINSSMKYEKLSKSNRRVKYNFNKDMITSSNHEYNNQVFSYLKNTLEFPNKEISSPIQKIFKKDKIKKDKENEHTEQIIKTLKEIDITLLYDGRIGKNIISYSIEDLQVYSKLLGISSAGKRKKEIIKIIRTMMKDYGIL